MTYPARTRAEERRETLTRPYTWLREHTLCRLDRHCKLEKGIKKFDSGRYPVLCRHCRKIIGGWR